MLRALQRLTFIAMSACAPQLAIDGGPFAIAAGDPTALLSGCGSPASVGYLYCRFQEGWRPSGEVRIVLPPAKCGLDSCASVTVFRPDGGRVLDAAAPEGTTHVVVEWTKLLGTEPIDKSARGFWPVLVKWVWLNDDGLLEQALVEGEIRVRVYAAGYAPLGAEPARWHWRLNDTIFRVTERGRAFVEASK